jgi:ABC-2 type transport system ATP-binding protein
MVTIEGLTFSYRAEQLFSRLELFLAAGGICGLLGKNGAGKTTLLKLLAGLLFPRTGEIQVAGRRPAERALPFLQELFLVPEDFQLPGVSPRQYQRLFAPFYPAFDQARFSAYLEQFELNAGDNLARCSFGQRKKCLLAFGLAANCRLTLLDEPTNGLDIPSKSQFRRVLASVLTEDRLFIIATHQVRDLESLIDPVVIMDEGRVIFNHSLEEITQRLRIDQRETPPDPDRALYSEKSMEGYRVMTPNPGDGETHMDLEMLFNTVMQSREKVAAVFEGR